MIMKYLLVCTLLWLPFAAISQNKSVQSPTGKELKPLPLPKEAPALYMELILSEATGGGQRIRMDFGKEQLRNFSDRELVAQYEETANYFIASVPDAMQFLKSLGFLFVSEYHVMESGKMETHLVFERDLSRRKERPTGIAPDAQPGRTSPGRPSGLPTPAERK